STEFPSPERAKQPAPIWLCRPFQGSERIVGQRSRGVAPGWSVGAPSARRLLTMTAIDLLHHRQCCFRFLQTRNGCASQASVLKKFSHFYFPRLVAAWVFIDGCFRWSHLRQHFVVA